MPTIIDLRSDTVTLPPPEMRRAMYEAELGDDVYREDPTINRLQERTAALLGMEAALFVPSGTMGNLVAVLTHCRRGDEIILGDESHMFHYEGGNSSVLGGTAMHPVPNAPDGTIPLETLRAAVREHTVGGRADDHDDARAVADGLAEIRGVRLAQGSVQTHPVIVAVAEAGLDPPAFVHDLEEAGVLGSHFGGSLLRFVTHYGIERSDVEETVARVHQVMTSRSY